MPRRLFPFSLALGSVMRPTTAICDDQPSIVSPGEKATTATPAMLSWAALAFMAARAEWAAASNFLAGTGLGDLADPVPEPAISTDPTNAKQSIHRFKAKGGPLSDLGSSCGSHFNAAAQQRVRGRQTDVEK